MIRSPAPSTAPDAVVRSRAAAIGAPRIGVAVGGVAAQRRRRRPTARSEPHRHRWATSSGSTSARYWSPRRGDERRLGHDDEPVGAEPVDELDRARRRRARRGRRGGRRRRPTRRARGPARRGSRSARPRSGRPSRAARERGDDVVRARQAGVVEDDLHRAAAEPDVDVGQRGRTGDRDIEREPGPARRVGQRREVAAVRRRREVGDAGDPEGGELAGRPRRRRVAVRRRGSRSRSSPRTAGRSPARRRRARRRRRAATRCRCGRGPRS